MEDNEEMKKIEIDSLIRKGIFDLAVTNAKPKTIIDVTWDGYKNTTHIKSKEKKSIILENGSLLLMGDEMQHYWKHQIAKTKKVHSPRINLTFRLIR